MFKVVVLNGKPQSGKDTFVTLCSQVKGFFVDSVSTVDFVKDVAQYCGWDQTKSPKNRQFLSDLKKLLTEWNDIPHKDVIKTMTIAKQDYHDYFWEQTGVFFIHSREPEDIQYWVDNYNAIKLKIVRYLPDAETQTNHSDLEVDNVVYDYVIENNGTKAELAEKAEWFLNEIKTKYAGEDV